MRRVYIYTYYWASIGEYIHLLLEGYMRMRSVYTLISGMIYESVYTLIAEMIYKESIHVLLSQ